MGIYIIYARVSTEEQARQGYSLEEQRSVCRQRAQELARLGGDDAPVLVEFLDDLSGDLAERPVLRAALDLVRTRRATAFICLDPDRLARNLKGQLLATDEIERAGCRLEFVQHEYRHTPEGHLFYQVRGAIAEFEKAKILERMSRGARGKARAGGLPAYVGLYGYQFQRGAGRVAAAQTLVPEPRERAWVQTIFRWCAEEGLGPHRIAGRLNALGVPAKRGGAWSDQAVRRILRNPTYATGELVWGRRDHRGIAAQRRLPVDIRRRQGIRLSARPRPPDHAIAVAVTPIVTGDLFHRAQTVLAGFRLGGRAAGGSERRRLLTGLGRCGVCGSALHYYSGRKIVCAGRLRGVACSLPAKSASAIEAVVWRQVERWCHDPKAIAWAESRWEVPARQDPRVEAEALRALVAQKRAEVARWGALYAQGRVPDTIALPEIQAARAAWLEAERRLTQIEAGSNGASAPPALVRDAAQWLAATDLRQELPPDRRASVVHALVASYTVHPTARGQPPDVTVIPVWASPPPVETPGQ